MCLFARMGIRHALSLNKTTEYEIKFFNRVQEYPKLWRVVLANRHTPSSNLLTGRLSVQFSFGLEVLPI